MSARNGTAPDVAVGLGPYEDGLGRHDVVEGVPTKIGSVDITERLKTLSGNLKRVV
jgi:hypothetical protein